MKPNYFFLGSLLVLLLLGSCQNKKQKPQNTKQSDKLKVYTVNYPLQYFAQRIGGEWVDVKFPAPADVDPAYWHPGAESIGAYQQADVILLNGASYAQWVDKVTLPVSKLYNTSGAFVDKLITIEGEATHSHGAEGKHAHGKLAFTTWLNPNNAIEQAQAIQQVFIKTIPEQKAYFEQQFQILKKELLKLDEETAQIISQNPDKALLFSHPVYQYFEKQYQINGRSVHWEPEEYPTPEMWHDLDHMQEHHHAKVMVWEGDPGKEVVEELKKRGINSIVFSPCGNVPEKDDYMGVMQANLENLQQAFGK